jgi:hypothetical protein
MKPRTGEVYWNPRTKCNVVVYGCDLNNRWRIVSIPVRPMLGERPKYGYWKQVPVFCTRLCAPKK